MAAILTSERGSQEKIVKYINECREMGIRDSAAGRQCQRRVLHADRQAAFASVWPRSRMSARSAITSIVAKKPFKSLFDFCERVDLRTVNKRVIESLIKAGAFDSVDPDRALLYNNIDRAMDWGQTQAARKGSRAGRSIRNDGGSGNERARHGSRRSRGPKA